MENNNYNSYEELTFNENMNIEGGGFFYDTGHFVGTVGREIMITYIIMTLCPK